jgi:hypothetical protein
MSRAHRAALARLHAPPTAVFLDTTAGFETNADEITAKAVHYYAQRLQTELRVASYRHAGRAGAAEIARAVAAVRAANFLFAGPGSPSYALQQWRGSPVWDAVLERFLGGAHLLLASAAAITAGRYSLPVYEIYKAGHDPYWLEGTDLLGAYGLSLAVEPHFDDRSGGKLYDSRYCYMGAARFDALQRLLPAEVAILGIDESTTVTFLPDDPAAPVGGQRSATVIAGGERSVWPSGSAIPLERLRPSRSGAPADAALRQVEAEREAVPSGVTMTHAARPVVVGGGGPHAAPLPEGEGRRSRGAAVPLLPRPFGGESGDERVAGDARRVTAEAETLEALDAYLFTLPGLDAAARVELLARAEALAHAAAATTAGAEEPLVDLVLELRAALRAAKRWDLADRARLELERLGYRVADSPTGSTWERA